MARPGGRGAGSSRPKPRRAATIDDLDDGAIETKSEPWDWSTIVGGVAILAAVALTVVFPQEQLVEAALVAVVVPLAIWFFRPEWLPMLRIGAVAVMIAACARFGYSVLLHSHGSTDSRMTDEAREVRRGDAHLKQRLQKAGGL